VKQCVSAVIQIYFSIEPIPPVFTDAYSLILHEVASAAR
jgi:hypothetical protein